MEMLELTMASTRSYQESAILLKHAEHLADLPFNSISRTSDVRRVRVRLRGIAFAFSGALPQTLAKRALLVGASVFERGYW